MLVVKLVRRIKEEMVLNGRRTTLAIQTTDGLWLGWFWLWRKNKLSSLTHGRRQLPVQIESRILKWKTKCNQLSFYPQLILKRRQTNNMSGFDVSMKCVCVPSLDESCQLMIKSNRRWLRNRLERIVRFDERVSLHACPILSNLNIIWPWKCSNLDTVFTFRKDVLAQFGEIWSVNLFYFFAVGWGKSMIRIGFWWSKTTQTIKSINHLWMKRWTNWWTWRWSMRIYVLYIIFREEDENDETIDERDPSQLNV